MPATLVVVEGPTYLGALMAFRGFAAQIAVVPMDDDGLKVDELERRSPADCGRSCSTRSRITRTRPA